MLKESELKGIVACDCEMSYSLAGIELTRVTLVGVGGERVLDEVVKPEFGLVDANTRFSGVSEQHIKDATVCFGDVLQRVEAFVGRDTILLGHGLENDLKAMRVYS
jgi:RNA exonuclease 1